MREMRSSVAGGSGAEADDHERFDDRLEPSHVAGRAETFDFQDTLRR